jgi:hypothetical protein
VDSNSRLSESNLSSGADSGPQPALQESMVLVETPLMGKDGRQYIGAPRPLTQLSSKALSSPLLLSPELPIRFAGHVSGKGAIAKRPVVSADNVSVATGKIPAVSVTTIPTIQTGASAGR